MDEEDAVRVLLPVGVRVNVADDDAVVDADALAVEDPVLVDEPDAVEEADADADGEAVAKDEPELVVDLLGVLQLSQDSTLQLSSVRTAEFAASVFSRASD